MIPTLPSGLAKPLIYPWLECEVLMTKFFVAFNFSSDGLLSRKIIGFRKRFDPKFNHYSFPHMAVLAPFEINQLDEADLAETLKEECETFFYGKNETPKLDFTGLGVFEHKRKNILYLNPSYDSDLHHYSEMILDICKSFIPKTVRYNENKKQFLPLGYFTNQTELQAVVEKAKEEFHNNSALPIESISLYQNRMGIWFEKEVLVDFEENEKQFLHLNRHTL